MKRSRLVSIWPTGLIGRVTLVLLAAVLLEFAGSAAFYEQAASYSASDAHAARIAEQLATNASVLSETSVAQRAGLADMLSTSALRIAWMAVAQEPAPAIVERPDLATLHSRLIALEPRLEGVGLALEGNAGAPDDVAGQLRLLDGSTVRFAAPGMLTRQPVTRGLFSAALLAGCVLLAAVLLVRTLSQPLRAVARLADAIGHDAVGPHGNLPPGNMQRPAVAVPLSVLESGPQEARHLARAMNAMQARITRLIADRTEALAAVSHDLRTPLARLRLRAGFLEDHEAQAAIEADVGEMEAMVGSVLAYLSGEDDPELRRNVDLASLLATLVDEAADAGGNARYHGPDHALARLRPLAMKRVFSNLIGNALTYGGNASVSLVMEGECLQVLVEDDGPGIPEDELERVLVPFYRVEGSRSRSTGGLGLGLAIVQREVLREGGTLRLAASPTGGLQARVSL